MRMLRSLVSIMVLCVVLHTAVFASDSAPQPDIRLAKRLSIQCVNVRLHAAVERISQASGVAVRTGKKEDDWRTRDVPILVCAKDMPLGELLQDVAATAHLILSRYRHGQEEPTYRIWRDMKREKDLAEYLDAVQAATLAAAHYDWDIWSRLKDIPDSEFKTRASDAAGSARRRDEFKDVSRIISSMGDETRDRIIGGDFVKLVVKTSSGLVQESLKRCLLSQWQGVYAASNRDGKPVPEEMPEGELGNSMLTIAFGRDPMEAGESMKLRLWIGDRGIHDFDCGGAVSLLRQDQYKLPPRPRMPDLPAALELPEGYVPLDPWAGTSTPLLTRKVKLPLPKDKKDPTYADALAALSKAAGVSIICEDFESYTVGTVLSRIPELAGLFGREVTVEEVLKFAWRMNWRINKDGTVIAGASKDWADHHTNLVAESVIRSLQTKLNGSGVVLDDLQSLSELSRAQTAEWIYPNPKLRAVRKSAGSLCRGSLWSIYFALDAADRAAAKSANGLSLGKLDREWLASTLKRRSQARQGWVVAQDRSVSADSAKNDAIWDPDTLPDLTLLVSKQQFGEQHSYFIAIEGEKDGGKVDMRDNLGAFPMYSDERRAELKVKTSGSK